MTKQLTALVTVMLVSTLLIAGCSATVKGPYIQAQVNSIDEINRLVDAFKAGDTATLRNTKAKDLPASNEDVIRLLSEATGFVKAISIVDYRTIKGDEVMPYLSLTLLRRYAAEGGKDAIVNEAKRLKLVTSGDVEPQLVVVNKDNTAARVDAMLYITYSDASDELQTQGVELGKEYTKPYTVWLVRQNDVWKVDGYKSGTLTK